MPIKELCRMGGFSVATFYKWPAKYGGMDVPDAKLLRELEGSRCAPCLTAPHFQMTMAKRPLQLETSNKLIPRRWMPHCCNRGD